MGVVIPQVITEDKAGGAQVIDGSLKFDKTKTQYLRRTISTSTSANTWTFSCWIKRSSITDSAYQYIFSYDSTASRGLAITSSGDGNPDCFYIYDGANINVGTARKVRDASAWYHLVLRCSSGTGTLYLNGESSPYITAAATMPNMANGQTMGIGVLVNGSLYPLNAQLSNVYFIDGQALDPSYFGYTDPLTNTWRPKKFKPQATPNNGTTWSNDLTSNVGFYAGEGAIYAFDGDNTTYASVATGGASNYINFSCNIPIVSTLRVKVSTATNYVYINGSGTPAVSGTGYLTVPSPPANLTQLRVYGDTGVGARIYAIEVDGIELLDGDTSNMGANAFYLPFDGNSPIGQDRSGRGNNWTPVNFGGSNTIEKATGALPILNTDGGGKVARVGVRTDSNASSLVLALPLVGIKSDFSNAINGGTSNKAITANSATASSSYSNFYGGSFYFNGSSNLTLNLSSVSLSSPYTVEFWWYKAGTQSGNHGHFCLNGANNQTIAYREVAATGTGANDFYIDLGGSFVPGIITQTISTGSWNHFAFVHEGSGVLKSYLNGVLQTTKSIGTSGTMGSTTSIGGGIGSYTGQFINGYVQDYRIYQGAKYTQNFIPASTDPDILPDTPSGVAYSSNVTAITDGAVAFDGSGDYLSLGSSADFAFGTGDFTFEFYSFFSGSLPSNATFYSNNYTGTQGVLIQSSSAALYFYVATSSVFTGDVLVAGKWQHILISRSSGTVRIFVDGVLQASGTLSGSAGNSSVGVTLAAGSNGGVGFPLTGFISNFHVVNGTALYTSNFTPPTAPITSVANTKLLCCKSNSSATAFDVSPGSITANGNTVATNFNPFTVNINTQRGQESGWCTWNPLDTAGSTLSNGNLNITTPSSGLGATRGTIGISSGKWYYEHTIISGATAIGIMKLTDILVSGSGIIGASAGGYSYYSEGVAGGGYTKKINNGTQTDYGASFDPGDTISVAFDLDAGTITFYKNGISQGIAFSGLSGTFSAAISDGTNAGSIVGATNFGQKPFKFPPPAGFQPLALANTPRPTIVRPDQYVGVTTYSGDNGSTRQVNVGFKPDFIWLKCRNVGRSHRIIDTVRGVSNQLFSDSTSGGNAYDGTTYASSVTSVNNSGFVLTNSGTDQYNTSGENYVAWCWKAGGNSNTYNINDIGYSTASAAGLTAGTITPSGASVNTKSGFSIITYTGNNTVGATISHGLGRVPAFAIFKNRGASSDWQVYHQSLGNATSIILQTTAAAGGSSAFNSTSPTSTLFTFGQGTSLNSSGGTHVGYLWAEIPGFSKFGIYTGNGSADGPVIITGFRPRWVMVKGSTFTSNWNILDAVRDPYNLQSNRLRPNLSNIEASDASGTFAICWDALSNGFKLRGGSSTNDVNQTNETFIYAAFAETPSFNLYGGQSNAR